MTVVAFMGPAGTGKTWSLLRALEGHLQRVPLTNSQCVLGLTFMHGSRRRLHERLTTMMRGRFECHTFDRFAWEVVRRWRTRSSADPGPALPAETSVYDATCIEAARLLEAPDVASWVVRRFPVLIVDEFQDCSSERLGIIQALAPHAHMFVAADEFQDLRRVGANEAVAWLAAQGGVQQLTTVHRTDRAGLLAAALAVREGRRMTNGVGFKIETVPSSPLAASKITFLIAGTQNIELAVLSPARPGNATFIDEIVTNVSSKQYGKAKKVGPYSLRWEETSDTVQREAIESLGLEGTDDTTVITAPDVLARNQIVLSKPLARWVEHQRRVCGKTSFAHGELRTVIQHAVQQRRSHRAITGGRLITTIHQAKNREFEHVVVLWPYQVTKINLMARRLLYNALTRARTSALVLVQDPKSDRISKAPFV